MFVRDAWADEGEKLAKSCDMSAWIYALFCVTSILISTNHYHKITITITIKVFSHVHISILETSTQ